jgi:hypothetical protein
MDLVATVKELREETQIRNLSSNGYDNDPLASIELREHKFFSSFGDKTEILAWEKTAFNDGELWSELESIERAYKTLKKISSGMDKIYQNEGNYVDFAERLKRVASILGIKKFAWRTSGNSGWYSKDEYRVTDLRDAIEHIRHTVRTDKRWNEELALKGIKRAA